MDRQPSVRSLVDGVGDPEVRRLCHGLVGELARLHEAVVVSPGPVDIRAEAWGRQLCRIVPYRELVHVQVGERPTWETRVRDEVSYLEAVDMILSAFLRSVPG
jgi:hypothetical protein